MTLAFRLPPCPDSPLRRLDPRWKLAALGLATVATALPRTVPAAAVALACALFLAGLARLPLRWLLERLGALALVLAPFVLFLPFLVGSPGGTGVLPVGGRWGW